MSGGPSFTEYLRAIDDSDLDVYEARYLIHIWRRGACWETVRKVGELCGMSKSQAHRAKASLLRKGWLTEGVEAGRFVQRVALPPVGIVVVVPGRDKMEEDAVVFVPTGDTVVPTRDKLVPTRHTLPLIEQNEMNPTKCLSAPEPGDSPSQVDPELIAAREATFGLIAFWEELTKRKRPDDETLFREKWLKPFNEIWIACGRNLDTAKAKVQAVRNSILAGGGRIFDPSKLPAHVQALVDVELLPMTAALNGNGHSNGRVNFRNDPEAREAHNRAVFAQVAAEYESGEWTPWTV